MNEIFLSYFIFLFIVFSNGLIFSKVILKFSTDKFNFFEYCIFGIIFTSFLGVTLNFFFPLNDNIIFFNLIIGLLFIFFNFKNMKFFNLDKYYFIGITLIFILSVIQLYGSGYSDDLGHYHGGSIINADNHKIIVGYNFLHHHYGYSSIWLILHSYLNFNNSFLQDIHVLNSLTFFTILSYFYCECIRKKTIASNYLLYLLPTFFLIFFLIKYTRLKEFGLDRPGILIYCFLIYFFIKNKSNLFNKLNYNSYLVLFSLIALFLTSIKVFFISSFIIILIIILRSNSYNSFKSAKFFIFYFFLSIYLLKNVLVSGCIIYPIQFTCLEILSWHSKDIAENLLIITEASTKSYDRYVGNLENYEFIKEFNWFKTWIYRNYLEFINYLGTILLSSLLLIFSSKNSGRIEKFNYLHITIYFLFLINIIIFLKIPVIRYHHLLFIFTGLTFLILLKKNFMINGKRLFLVLLICFTFNLTKNINRVINNNFYNSPLDYLKKINWYTPPIKQKKDNFIYYNGWIGASPIGNMSLKDYKHSKLFNYNIISRY